MIRGCVFVRLRAVCRVFTAEFVAHGCLQYLVLHSMRHIAVHDTFVLHRCSRIAKLVGRRPEHVLTVSVVHTHRLTFRPGKTWLENARHARNSVLASRATPISHPSVGCHRYLPAIVRSIVVLEFVRTTQRTRCKLLELAGLAWSAEALAALDCRGWTCFATEGGGRGAIDTARLRPTTARAVGSPVMPLYNTVDRRRARFRVAFLC